MKKIILFFILMFIISPFVFSQRVLIDEHFETAGLNADSLPLHWAQFDVDQTNPTFPHAIWQVRDTGASFPGVNASVLSKANNYSKRGLSIPWRAGDPVADDWVITDSLVIQTGDSLIFWMLLGTPADSILGINLTHYIDSMQVHVCAFQDPNVSIQKLATIRSLDSDNVWTQHSFNLNAFNGQIIYIAFRYYMNTTVDGLWCNIDDIFVGNHSAIGIHPISTNLPKEYNLRQNYPNPFNPVTNIEFSLPKASYTTLKVYDILGREVRNLVNESLKPGVYKVDFDATNLPSGAYFYRLETVDFVKTNKMILTK